MDIGPISAAAVMMQAGQAQQGMATTLVKMAAEQQSQVADMLAQSADNASRIVAASGHGFSTYA